MKFSEVSGGLFYGNCQVKRDRWSGYWAYSKVDQTIYMHCKDGEVIDIRDTEDLQFTLDNVAANDWVFANEENCPVLRFETHPELATHSFSWAIEQLKEGQRVARKGWNGKGQYIELGTDFEYVALGNIPGPETKVSVYHKDIGSQAIVFVGTSGRQVGWLASQADMLAEDWVLHEEGQA